MKSSILILCLMALTIVLMTSSGVDGASKCFADKANQSVTVDMIAKVSPWYVQTVNSIPLSCLKYIIEPVPDTRDGYFHYIVTNSTVVDYNGTVILKYVSPGVYDLVTKPSKLEPNDDTYGKATIIYFDGKYLTIVSCLEFNIGVMEHNLEPLIYYYVLTAEESVSKEVITKLESYSPHVTHHDKDVFNCEVMRTLEHGHHL